MWSDPPSPADRGRLVARLRSLLPAPAPGARAARTPLRRAAPPLAVAHELHALAGFSWLDGGDGGGPDGGHRLAAEPIAVLSYRAGDRGGRATLVVGGHGGRSGVRRTFAARGFDLVEAALDAWGGAGGVLIGSLGYELGGEIESLPAPAPDDLALPDLRLALYDRVLVREGEGWCLESTDAWRGLAGDHRERDPVHEAEERLARAAALSIAAPAPARYAGHTRSAPDRDGFERAVAHVVERIAAGEIFQANLCRRIEAPLPAREIWPTYLRLRQASPAIRGAFFDAGPGRAILSISPEIFLSVRGRTVETRPIKGTRRRGSTPAEDRALARELGESRKDLAELAMIVDVARNDLGRVAVPGSITAPELARLVTLPTVHHLVATVRGTLREGVGAGELLRATFPAASISGAPKIRAMSVIAAEEPCRRGPAMGAFGWLSMNGDLELAVAIRTAVAHHGRVAYHAGCGITADSLPELEREESETKAAAFLRAIGRLEGD